MNIPSPEAPCVGREGGGGSEAISRRDKRQLITVICEHEEVMPMLINYSDTD